MIQLLPDAPRGSLMIMTERLESLPPIDKLLQETGGDATKLLEELLFGMPFAQLDRRPVFYRCQCSREAVVGALSTLSRAELAELVATEDVIELTCDYCNTGYKVGRQHLQGLLTPS